MPKYAEEILAAVTELQQHPKAEQVFLEMKREHPSIVTVFATDTVCTVIITDTVKAVKVLRGSFWGTSLLWLLTEKKI